MTKDLAPVAFFCYNRPDYTRRTLSALRANELASDSRLFIFSDGPKDNEKSREGVAKVREYLRTVDGFASVEIIEREKNYGCGRNIAEGTLSMQRATTGSSETSTAATPSLKLPRTLTGLLITF